MGDASGTQGRIVTAELLVTIHDQDLLLECEASGQFDGLPRTYLFVGPRPVDKLTSEHRTLVVRDHQPNFEHYPQFYDFTGWWAACHHGLIDADRVVCVQYDMLIADVDIVKRCDELLDDPDTSMVAFTAGHRLADNWMLLLDGFQEMFDEGMRRVGVNHQEMWPFFNEWPSTQGTAWRTTDLTQFMEWVTPLFDVWHGDVWAGHLMERTVKPWTVIDGRPEAYLGGVITHLNRDCHGTCARMGGRLDVYAERAATFGR